MEKVGIEDEALHAIARGADGGMRDAESTLDQLISFCGDKIVEADVLSMFGLTARGQLVALAEALLAGDLRKSLAELDELAKHGKDLARLVSDLLNHFRNLLIYQVSNGDLGLLEISEFEAGALATQSTAVSRDGIARIMEVFTDCEARLRDTSSKRILIEVSLHKAIQARNAISIDQLLQQLRELRAAEGGPGAPDTLEVPTEGKRTPIASVPTSPAPVAAKGGRPAPSKPEVAFAAQPKSTEEVELDELWGKVLDAVGRVSQFTRTYLLEAHPVSFTKNVLTIGFDPEFADHLGLVDNARNHALLQTKLAELGQPNVQLKFVQAEAPGPRPRPATSEAPVAATAATPEPSSSSSPAPGPAPVANGKSKAEPVVLSKEDLKNDPLIQKALEIFKGQIVDIRA